MYLNTILVPLIVVLSGCQPVGRPEGETDGGSVDRDTPATLWFTVSDYQSSALLNYDMQTGSVSRHLSGLSGDVGLFAPAGDLLVFNRGSSNSSYFKLSDPGQQRRSPGAGFGDPLSVLSLEGQQLMVANYSAGNLQILDLNSSAYRSPAAPEDIPSFRPTDIYGFSHEGRRFAAILHQGRARDFSYDGSQAVYVYELAASGQMSLWKAIPLSFPNALKIQPTDDPLVCYVVSFCNSLDRAACSQGIEKVELLSGSAQIIWDLSETDLRYNGGLATNLGPNYADMLAHDLGSSKNSIVRLFFGSKTIETRHHFAGDDPGCCGFLADPASGSTFFSSGPAGGPFFLSRLSEQGDVTSLRTEKRFYTGAVVP